MEPDPEYPTERKRWVTDKFNPTRDKFNDKIEESETIYLNYRNKTRAVFFSQEGSFYGLGGLTYSVDLMDPDYADIIKSMGTYPNRFFTEQMASMIGDLMMFNDEDKIFTFV